MSRIFFASLFFTFTFAVCAQNGGAEVAKQEVISTLVQMWDAIEKEDIDRYASYLHPDFTAFGETDTYLSEGKKLEVLNVTNWLEHADHVHTEMHNPQVTIQGDVAWILYYWTDSGVSRGEPFSSQGKSTRIFLKENGRWLCVHGHYTLVGE